MSMRRQILECIDRDVVVLDDIITEIGGEAAKVRNNIQAARGDGLIESYRDDITNRPAYKLTPAGRQRLNALSKTGGDTESEGGDADVRPDAQAPAMICDALTAEKLNAAWAELRAIREAVCANPDEATIDEVQRIVMQVVGLQRELGQERTTRAALEEQVQALHAQLDSQEAVTYLIRAAKTEPRIVFRYDRAVERAKSVARKTGRADVYALHHVGKAVRGAEWVEG